MSVKSRLQSNSTVNSADALDQRADRAAAKFAVFILVAVVATVAFINAAASRVAVDGAKGGANASALIKTRARRSPTRRRPFHRQSPLPPLLALNSSRPSKKRECAPFCFYSRKPRTRMCATKRAHSNAQGAAAKICFYSISGKLTTCKSILKTEKIAATSLARDKKLQTRVYALCHVRREHIRLWLTVIKYSIR